jgi:lipid-binding SYLF domain-containing protein
MRTIKVVILSLLSILIFSGFMSETTPKERKNETLKESEKTLKMLHKAYPKAKALIDRSYGYATFSNFGLNLLFFSAEGGSGIVHNNKTSKNTYMKMASGGVGLGIGVKDFRTVFVFGNKKVFDSFINSGWEANAQADLAAKSGDKGKSIEGAITVQPGIKLYKLTKNGLAVQATIQGTKYWKDEELNK